MKTLVMFVFLVLFMTVGTQAQAQLKKDTVCISAYPVEVDYGKTIEEMVKSGKYLLEYRAKLNINSKNFTSKRQGKVNLEIELIYFDFSRRMSSTDVLSEFDKRGLRPVELKELLAFADKYPDMQKEFCIIELGSIWQDEGNYNLYVSLASFNGSARTLKLKVLCPGNVRCFEARDDRYHSDNRFAAVKK